MGCRLRVVVDLDGVLACNRHREHWLTQYSPKQWDAFFAEYDRDPLIYPWGELLPTLVRDHDVQVWTARPSTIRGGTLEWLNRVCVLPGGGSFVPYVFPWDGGSGDVPVLMRDEGDFTDDNQLKRLWFNVFVARGWRPDLVFEDRGRVVDMWRDLGVACFQTQPGDF